MPPETGWLGYIAAHQWLNVIAFGLAALLLIVATRGHLGYGDGPGGRPHVRNHSQ